MATYFCLWATTFHKATTSWKNDVWATITEIPHWWRVTYSDLGSASDWLYHKRNLLQPIGSTTQIWAEMPISMEFLELLFTRHFWIHEETNSGCFLSGWAFLCWIILRSYQHFLYSPTSILYLWGCLASSIIGITFVLFLATLMRSRPDLWENSTAYTRPS